MLKNTLIILFAKIVRTLCRLAKKQGVTLAGAIAYKLNPNILHDLAKQIPTIIIICGTNGKTTTNNLMNLGLTANSKKVLTNATGSNMLNGIVSAFVLGAKANGKMDYEYATLEIDEASLRLVLPHIHCEYLVLTNFFRDQLDRYGEIDTTMDLLRQGLVSAPNATIIFNSDDVLSTTFVTSLSNPSTSFGIDHATEYSSLAHDDMKEGQFCPKCSSPLHYHFYHYAQLGDFYCPNCGFKHLPIDVNATHISCIDPLKFTINNVAFNSTLKGFYNIYNHLAVATLLVKENLSLSLFANALTTYKPTFGRLEQFEINGNNILLNLAKNPAGFNQNIDLVLNDTNPKDIIIAINDNEQDGIDVSWLWDVDFHRLAESKDTRFIVSGTRYMDMALRLKYEDISYQCIESIPEAIQEYLKTSKTHNIYCLVNYTALYPTSQYLHRLVKENN